MLGFSLASLLPKELGPGLDCSEKLVGPEGSMVSLNFLEMDMLTDAYGGCLKDYVHLSEEEGNVDVAVGTFAFHIFIVKDNFQLISNLV